MNLKKKLTTICAIIALLSISSIVLLKNNDKETNNKLNQHSQLNPKGENNMNAMQFKINININGTNYTATLEDNNTTREFIKRLPLTITMTELNGNEKYYYFNDSFPSSPARIGKINSGDLMLYGDNCFVLFYESFNTSYSYTRIGKIDNPSSLKSAVGKGNIKISLSN